MVNSGMKLLGNLICNGNVGIGNILPWVSLNLGNFDVGGSSGSLVLITKMLVEVLEILEWEWAAIFSSVLEVVVMLVIVPALGHYNWLYHTKRQKAHLQQVQQPEEPLECPI